MAKSTQISNSSNNKKEGGKTKKVRATIQNKDYQVIKNSELEVTDDFIEAIARHKSYYLLSNAKWRTDKRDDYKDVEYHLGAYKEGYDYIKEHQKDLHVKLLNIIKTYVENDFNSDLAPTVHRLDQHYKWDSIDILSKKDHEQIHAIETPMLAVDENGGLYFDRFDSKSDAKTELNLNEDQLNKLLKGTHRLEFTDIETVNLDNVATIKTIGMEYTKIEPFKNEEDYKAYCESKGITYEPPTVREERAERMLKQVKEKKLDAKLS